MSETCHIDGCDNPIKVKSRGLCNLHYRRFQRHGDPTAGRIPDGEQLAFLLSFRDDQTDVCIAWPYGRNSIDGRGVVYYQGRMMSVGRVMCLEVKGSPPEGKPEAAHSCGNGGGGCFNPNHLYWASKAENYRDRVTHGVSQRGPRHGMAKLTEGDVREIRNLCAGGVLQRAVAARFNIARPTVSTIVQRRNWQWVD